MTDSALLQKLKEFTQCVAGEAGEDFFPAYVRALCRAAGADHAALFEISGESCENARLLAVCSHGRPALEGEGAGPPRSICRALVREEISGYVLGMRSRFPDDRLLASTGADGGIGTLLRDFGGIVNGMLLVLYDRPVEDPGTAAALVELCARPAAVELERRRILCLLEGERRVLEMLAGGETLDDILSALAENVRSRTRGLSCRFVLRDAPECVAQARAAPERPSPDGWSIPIRSKRGDELGALIVQSTDPPPAAKRDLEVLDRAVYLAGIAIEHKAAEQRLQASEQKLRFISENAAEVILAYDMDRRLIYVNPAVEEQTGYSTAEMRRRHFIKWVHPEDDARMMDLWERLYQGEGYSGIEFRIVTKDGRLRWILGSWGPLLDENGVQVGVQGREIDITDRKHAEEKLRKSEMLLAESQRIAHLGSWDEDLASRELIWSEETYRIFGLPLDTPVTEELFFRSIHPDDYAAVRRASALAISEGRPYALDHRIVRPDGSERFVHEQAQIVCGESGLPARMFGTVQDITERRLLEERLRQSQKMEAIGQLAGGVAHDFNNLLTGILGHSELLLGSLADDHPLRQELTDIKRAAERAASLTRQLLAFSRKQVLQPRIIDLGQLVGNMSKMLRRLIREDIQLLTVCCPAAWSVRADPGQIEQVVLNLVLNARDAMPLGGTITIGVANLELKDNPPEGGIGPGQHVELSVSDTGTGMDEATRARIFEPFFTTKQQGKGTGLGLSTVYGIVNQSGGQIRVASRPGKGTTFRVYLPRVEQSDEDSRMGPEPVRHAHRTARILLVEDEDVVRRLVREILTQNGYQVLEARDASEALRLAEESTAAIELMLTDLIMPGMSGRLLAEKLSLVRPSTKVLYMSGYTDDSVLKHGVINESKLFLQKPFTPDVLLRAIREALAD